MTNFFDILEHSQLRAIDAAINPTAESIYRIKCREYSIKFHTALDQVMKLDPMFVAQTLFEDLFHPSIVNEELEELMDKLYIMKDPNYSRMKQEEVEDLVDAVLNKEIARAAKKKITSQEITSQIRAAEAKPKSGGLDFKDLKLDSET